MKGKPAIKAPPQTPAKMASAEDVHRAIDGLTQLDRLRLKDYARNRIYRIGPRAAHRRTEDDLLQEAVTRLLDGTRHWYPVNVDLVPYLIGSMRSIASEWAGHRKRNASGPEYAALESERTKVDDDGKTVSPFDGIASGNLNVEEQAIEQDIETERQALANEIEAEFKDDDAASMVILGLQSGMDGPAIQKDLGWTETEYRTTVRRIRRRVDKIAERRYGR